MSLVFSPLHFAAAVRASTALGSALAQWPRVLNRLTKATRAPTKDESEEIQGQSIPLAWPQCNAYARRKSWKSKSRDSPREIRDDIIHIAILQDTRMSPLRPLPIPLYSDGRAPSASAVVGSFRFGCEWIHTTPRRKSSFKC